MTQDHPTTVEFRQAVDRACGRMAALGLRREAMVWLADELACMLSNDSFEHVPDIPHSREFYRLMVALKCHLEGRTSSEDDLAALGSCLRALQGEPLARGT